MSSERIFAMAALAAACGCGNGLSGLAAEAIPLATLNVEVDVADARLRLPYEQLWVALAWGAAWENPAICYVTDDPLVQQACPDPYNFRPSLIEVAVPLTDDSDGKVTFELYSPPDTSVSVGGPDGRIAYGSIAVLSGSTMYNDGFTATLAPPFELAAASFISLHEPNRRVVFRQGEVDTASNFYPYAMDRCGEPPPGYSLLDVTNPLGDGSCAFADAGATIRPTPVPAEQASNWACLPATQQVGGEDPHLVNEPADDFDPIGMMGAENTVCVGTDIVVIVNGTYGDPTGSGCTSLSVWALKGCGRNLLCEAPEWDLTGNAPYWWPCE